jgi:hypothetical protein
VKKELGSVSKEIACGLLDPVKIVAIDTETGILLMHQPINSACLSAVGLFLKDLLLSPEKSPTSTEMAAIL